MDPPRQPNHWITTIRKQPTAEDPAEDIVRDLSNDEQLAYVVKLLRDQGCIVLRGKTRVDHIWVQRPPNPADLPGDKYIMRILNAAREGGVYVVRGYHCLYASSQKTKPFSEAAAAKDRNLLTFACHHMGGDASATWAIDVARVLNGQALEEKRTMSLNGLDVFICCSWLPCALPRPLLREPLPGMFTSHNLVLMDLAWREIKEQGQQV